MGVQSPRDPSDGPGAAWLALPSRGLSRQVPFMRVPRKWLPYLVCALSAAVQFAPFLRVLSHSGDEGELVNNAIRVTQGQLPFRDFFEGMAPGTYYLQAFYFKLLGTTWFATRVSLLVATV